MNKEKIKGLIELDLMRLDILKKWAKVKTDIKFNPYDKEPVYSKQGYAYTSHEGITEYNKDTQMYTLRKIIYRPSIDIYITVKHDNFINKFMEVFDLGKLKKEDIINTQDIKKGYKTIATFIKDSIKAYIAFNKTDLNLSYPDSNAFIFIFHDPIDNYTRAPKKQNKMEESDERTPIQRIKDAYKDIEKIFPDDIKTISEQQQKGEDSYLKNFLNDMQAKEHEQKEDKIDKVEDPEIVEEPEK